MKKKVRKRRAGAAPVRSAWAKAGAALLVTFLLGAVLSLWVSASAYRWLAAWSVNLSRVELLRPREMQELRRHLNPSHLRAVQNIAGVKTMEEVQTLAASGELKLLQDCAHYALKGVPKELAYLRPDAETVLAAIGARFADRLAAGGLPPVRLCVTSALRPADYQASLARHNSNAAERSTHETGQAFDLHYKIFPTSSGFLTPAVLKWRIVRWMALQTPDPVENAFKSTLGRILLDAQRERMLLVIHETRQPCFHVTALSPAR